MDVAKKHLTIAEEYFYRLTAVFHVNLSKKVPLVLISRLIQNRAFRDSDHQTNNVKEPKKHNQPKNVSNKGYSIHTHTNFIQ